MKISCLLSLIPLSFFLIGCNAEDGLVLENTMITLNPDEIKTVTIISGNGKYKLISPAGNLKDIVDIQFGEDIIYIKGNGYGSVKVMITDSGNRAEMLEIIVDDVQNGWENWNSSDISGKSDTITDIQ